MTSQSIKLEVPAGDEYIMLDVDVDYEVIDAQPDCGERGGIEVICVNVPKDIEDMATIEYITSQEAMHYAGIILNEEFKKHECSNTLVTIIKVLRGHKVTH